MNLFERWNNRLSRSSTPSHTPGTTASISASRSAQEFFPKLSVPEVKVTAPLDDKNKDAELRELYSAGVARGNRSASGGQTFRSDSISRLTNQAKPLSNLMEKKTKTPLSSFYNVSSDEDDESDEEAVDDVAPAEQHLEPGESAAEFQRRSLRIRRSLTKAKAALPSDFADRIGVSPMMVESVYRDVSGTMLERVSSKNLSTGMLEEHAVLESSSTDEDGPMEGDQYLSNRPARVSEIRTGLRGLTIQDGREGRHIESDHSSGTFSNRSKGFADDFEKSTVLWSREQPQPLEALMPYFRERPSGTTYLLKAIAQRPGCRCALCGHESLLLLPVVDTSLVQANWGTWSVTGRSHGRVSHHDRHSNSPHITSEIHSKLIIFRQCRGWYEILNESFHPIPHLITVEQMRRTKPSTFLVRQDLRCLLAPPTVTVPSIKRNPSSGDGPPPPPFPSTLIAAATAPETLMNSSIEMIPAGTLMHYVTYLPHCSVKRGRKMKELGLLLATMRPRRSLSPKMSVTTIGSNESSNRAYYIGLEDSTPAVFPPKFAISPVAGPENISGVHSMASILRKFRLPLVIKPVVPSEVTSATQGKESSEICMESTHSVGLSSGLSVVPDVVFSEQNFLRLESIFRSDILIVSPTTNPDRLFLITPTMLPDHVFQVGETADPTHVHLLENHRILATNFLSIAHSRESLNYLVRHMKDVTREPKESRSSCRSKNSLGGPSLQLTTDELHSAYDELDDIYFYIRHGYYPSKSKLGDVSSCKNENPRQPFNQFNDSAYLQTQTQMEAEKSQQRSVVPTAEALLAASLSTPVRSANNRPTWLNGTAQQTLPNHRSQGKEHGI